MAVTTTTVLPVQAADDEITLAKLLRAKEALQSQDRLYGGALGGGKSDFGRIVRVFNGGFGGQKGLILNEIDSVYQEVVESGSG